MECYFVSDVHLGAGNDRDGSKSRAFVEFLHGLQGNADVLYLLGDIFDFWLEYEDEIPSGYGPVLNELKALTQSGCKVRFFRGNHDYWTLDYFEKELGMEVSGEPYRIEHLNGLEVCVGHGDVVGCNSLKDRTTFFLFRNPFLIRILRKLPRRLISGFAGRWSASSRKSSSRHIFNLEKSAILHFCEKMCRDRHIDLFIFGHFHKSASTRIEGGAILHILGDWDNGENYLNLSGTTVSGRGFPKTVK